MVLRSSWRGISAVKVAEEWEFGRFFVGWMFGLVEIEVESETDGVGGSGRLGVRSLVVVMGMFGSWDGESGGRRLVLRSQREGLLGIEEEGGWMDRGRKEEEEKSKKSEEEVEI